MSQKVESQSAPGRRANQVACAEVLEPRALLAAAVATVAPAGPQPLSEAVEFNGAYYFFAAAANAPLAELWKTDGMTAAGTSLVAKVPRGEPRMVGNPPEQVKGPWQLVAAGGALYFLTNNEEWSPALPALWRSDGTTAGTRPISGAPLGPWVVPVGPLVPFGDRVYFAGYTSSAGADLWRTDGSPAGGLALFHDEPPGPAATNVHGVQVAGGALYFGTQFGVQTAQGYRERGSLWKSDGTAAGTAVVTSLAEGVPGMRPFLYDVIPLGGRLLMTERDLAQPGVRLSRVVPGSDTPEVLGSSAEMDSPTVFGGDLVFGSQAFDEPLFDVDGPPALWRSGGTPQTTSLLYGFGVLTPDDVAGAGRVGDTRQTSDGRFARLGHRLYFFHGTSLWRTDGTWAGTQKVMRFPADTSGRRALPQLQVVGDALVFAAASDAFGTELWKSDGTFEGTVMVADFAPGPAGSAPRLLGAPGGDLLVSALTGESRALFRFEPDGTTGPTVNQPPRANAAGAKLGYIFHPMDRFLDLDGTRSYDPEGGPLTYAWDLNGDGDFTDASGPTPRVTRAQFQLMSPKPAGEWPLRIRVTDAAGASATSVAAPLASVAWIPVEAQAGSLFNGAPVALLEPDGSAFSFRVVYHSAWALDPATVDGDDVELTDAAGVRLPVLAEVKAGGDVVAADGFHSLEATYRIPAPSGAATLAAVGWYAFRVVPGAVLNENGSTTFGHDLGPLQVVLETVAPTATLQAPPPTADNVYEFSIHYSDDTVLDPETLADAVVRVRLVGQAAKPDQVLETVPHGVHAAPSADGSWVVTYQIGRPASPHPFFHDGTYSVWSGDPAADAVVRDVSGNPLPAGEVGRFEVRRPYAGPDVSLSDLMISPTAVLRGARGRVSVQMSARMIVDGEPKRGASVPAADVTFYLTRNLAPRAGDPVLARVPGRAMKSLGKPRVIRASFTVPAGLAPGPYYLMAVADSGAALVEPNEGNNRVEAVLAVLEPYTQLAVSPQPPRKRVPRGGVISLVVLISNSGNALAAGTATVTVMLTRRGPSGAPQSVAEGVAPVRTQGVFRVSVGTTQGRKSGVHVRLKLTVPRDWPAGMVDALVTLEPDGDLAAIDRGGDRVRRLEVEVG